jgi:hypothetical protein
MFQSLQRRCQPRSITLKANELRFPQSCESNKGSQFAPGDLESVRTKNPDHMILGLPNPVFCNTHEIIDKDVGEAGCNKLSSGQ